jgi:hypothetical protein
VEGCSVWSGEAFCFALILPGEVEFGEYLVTMADYEAQSAQFESVCRVD